MLVTVAALGCMALAWWQWSRFQSNSGTFQNLGYALQWPMFGVFCFYAYYKFVRYEAGDAPAVAVVRGPAIVNRHDLVFAGTPSEPEITAAHTALAAAGILVR